MNDTARGTDGQSFAPRLVGVFVAALTDFSTSLLAGKLIGDGAKSGAVSVPLSIPFGVSDVPAIPVVDIAVQRPSAPTGIIDLTRDTTYYARTPVLPFRSAAYTKQDHCGRSGQGRLARHAGH